MPPPLHHLQIMYHSKYEYQFICLADMLQAVPDFAVGSCAISGSPLGEHDPEVIWGRGGVGG